MSIVQIEVKNWEKYNPRSDRKSSKWFRFQNDFFLDPKIYTLNNDQKILLMFIYCEVSKNQDGKCCINLQLSASILKSDYEKIKKDLEVIVLNKFISIDTSLTPVGDELTPVGDRSVPYERTNERNEHNERTTRERADDSRQTLRDEITDLELIDTWNQFFPEKIFPGLTLGAGKNRQNFEISVGFIPYKQNWVDLFQRCKNSKLAGLDPKFKCSWFNLIWILDHDNILKVQAGTFDTDEKTDEQLRQEDLEWAKNHSRKLQTV